ncbi:ATP-binding protein [Variovorax arabinosiphilus]|uniref:ATP-binding protein n=1 Tax=Variovorax arabinosiphilus TaxID=3053498 RepID=UPI002576CF25|nr:MULTISPECIES: ATP-binding protein [unclassified Variovorax]MDM0119977.1 ATP-binding protein [Variovorax sp. J2L1-78]MDM0128111.1 ATP-binding protein [Variovorax sp. J2L1-63]MDM0231811.1 ATP-binding protein [Variovorax sp. J2R1-6]
MTPSLISGNVIAVVGAESTGKTELARLLAERLTQRGIATTLVPEVLRDWCVREGRTPRPHEQAAIADEQTRRIAEAARHGVVVADTTALMTAVYSDMLFDDRALYPDALAAQAGYAMTLLTALDLPWVADGLQRDGPHVREPVDALVRAALARAGVSYAVVHGRGPERLASAWTALNLASDAEATAARRTAGEAWGWSCEKCSDPVCEHRLFTDLLSRRS